MYCSRCGKKVGDAMLFCPFCGEAIVIPEQDEPELASQAAQDAADSAPEQPPVEASAASEAGEASEASSGTAQAEAELLEWERARKDGLDEWSREAEAPAAFEPLVLDAGEEPSGDWKAEIEQKKEAAQPEKKPPQMHRHEDNPVRLEGSAPKLEAKAAKRPAEGKKPARKSANTLVPPKTMDPNDMFMAGKAAAYEDAFDDYDDEPAEDYIAPFAYEDEGETSFFMRHLRGIVGLALFAILILLFVIYAFSRSGQVTLARVNLAWSTEPYSQLGYQSYQEGRFSEAGQYYERALQRDGDNYSFASSAAMAYYEAGDVDRATAMLKRCVEINPTLLEPYIYLLKLYPDAAGRPWDVTQLLRQGYQQTGDSRLNVTG